MTSKGYIDFNSDYWCAFCGRKVHKGQEKQDKLGRPTDWKARARHLLRYKEETRVNEYRIRWLRRKEVEKVPFADESFLPRKLWVEVDVT